MSLTIPRIAYAVLLLLVGLPGIAQSDEPDTTPPPPVPFGGRAGTDPGQAENSTDIPRADLLLSKVVVGVVEVPLHARSAATLSSRNAVGRQNGKCQFQFQLVTRNAGTAAAVASTTSVAQKPFALTAVPELSVPPLQAGAEVSVAGKLRLGPGLTTLAIHSDAGNAITESDEVNNRRELQLNVIGDCR